MHNFRTTPWRRGAGFSPETELSSLVAGWRRPVLEKRQDLGVVETPLLRAGSLWFDRPTPGTLMATNWLDGERAGAAASHHPSGRSQAPRTAVGSRPDRGR